MPEVRSIEANYSAANVTLTTTAETVCIASPLVTMEQREQDFVIIGWCQVTTGTSVTSVVPRLRRGSAATGTLVSEANVEQDGIAAAKTLSCFTMAMEHRSNEASVQYCLTMVQTAADGNGTVLQSGIIVIAL